MLDINDKSLEHTALRETHEELGIKEADIEILGSGNLVVTRGDTCVLPVLGRIRHDLDLHTLHVNHHEVDEVFTVPLERLCDPHLLRYTQFRSTYSAPVFLGGSRRIWGLTAFITHAFLRCLLPTRAYNHKIRFVPSVKSLFLNARTLDWWKYNLYYGNCNKSVSVKWLCFPWGWGRREVDRVSVIAIFKSFQRFLRLQW